jgi:nucleotide-binding universal stress UspA family protein
MVQRAEQIILYVRRLAAVLEARLLLLQVVAPALEPDLDFRPLGRPLQHFDQPLAVARMQATNELNVLAEPLRQEGIAVKTVITTGHVAEMIVDEAAQRQADLIVMATHGYSGLKRWVLSSVADKTLHSATTPLILVPAGALTRAPRHARREHATTPVTYALVEDMPSAPAGSY